MSTSLGSHGVSVSPARFDRGKTINNSISPLKQAITDLYNKECVYDFFIMILKIALKTTTTKQNGKFKS